MRLSVLKASWRYHSMGCAMIQFPMSRQPKTTRVTVKKDRSCSVGHPAQLVLLYGGASRVVSRAMSRGTRADNACSRPLELHLRAARLYSEQDCDSARGPHCLRSCTCRGHPPNGIGANLFQQPVRAERGRPKFKDNGGISEKEPPGRRLIGEDLLRFQWLIEDSIEFESRAGR
jgi:hypothetical protein